MGTLFMVNPPKRKKRRTAAQKRATEKMLAANRRKRSAKKTARVATRRKNTTTRKRRATTKRRRTIQQGTTTMARKRKRRAATARRRTTTKRRRSTARRRSPVTRLRRNSVYLTNPRGKKRRRSRARYRRNPSIIAMVRQGAMDAGATLVGGAVARVATGLLPLPKDGLLGAASGVAVALGVGMAARKVVSSDTARFITAGAMQVPIKALITTFVPAAGAYLGDYDNMGAYALPGNGGMGDYLNPGGSMYGSPADNEVEVGVYE